MAISDTTQLAVQTSHWVPILAFAIVGVVVAVVFLLIVPYAGHWFSRKSPPPRSGPRPGRPAADSDSWSTLQQQERFDPAVHGPVEGLVPPSAHTQHELIEEAAHAHLEHPRDRIPVG